MNATVSEVATPLGRMLAVSDGRRLVALEFADKEERMLTLLRRRFGTVQLEQRQGRTGVTDRIDAYFAGDVAALASVPVLTGGTPFQEQVWAALRDIPAGATVTYGDVARRIGRPQASRAVGRANGLNPIALVIPCHRVIGSQANLTGYAGGLERKRWLLEHERRHAGAPCQRTSVTSTMR